MSFTLNPVFSFRLNQLIVGQIKFGKYDGIHVCLTAATSTDKVIIHSPHKSFGSTNNRLSWSESNYDTAMLNFNQEITAIETGCLLPNESKEILVIGSPTHVLAYNVDNNSDVFYNSVNEGITTILIGNYGNHQESLVMLGGTDSIRGFDSSGHEKFWLVANGKVNCLMVIDMNKDGKNELIAGTSSGNISIYKDDSLLMELIENAPVTNICQIEKYHLLSYTLNDGTLGVYDESLRLWRIKSKNKPTSLTSFDLLGASRHQLIVSWDSGKVDVRDFTTGDVLYKFHFNQPVTSVGQADYRGNGTNDLILCTSNGEVRGYEKSKINLFSIKSVDQEQLMTLLNKRKNLLAELSHYESNTKFNKERSDDQTTYPTPDNVGVIPANTRLQIGVYTNTVDSSNPHIEIKICTNNRTIIKSVLIFSEGIFASETYIAYPNEKTVSNISIPIKMPKDICYDINIKALVGSEYSQQFHVFELTRQLPKFSMYSLEIKSDHDIISEDNYLTFKINERMQRLCLWLNQNFLLPEDIELTDEESLKLYFISIRDRSPVELHLSEKDLTKIITTNIDLAGTLIQSLANFLNIENLQTTAHFPKIENEIGNLFRKIEGQQASYVNLNLDLSQKKNLQRNLLIRIEDARLYNPEALSSLFSDMEKLTEDMVSSYTIRQQNFAEIQRSLEGINGILKSSSKLRVGVHATNMMRHLKDAVKSKNIEAINKIITTGLN